MADWDVGDVLGVVSGASTVTMVSLDADSGASAGRLGCAAAGMPACVSSFILTLALEGGMYRWGDSSQTQKAG